MREQIDALSTEALLEGAITSARTSDVDAEDRWMWIRALHRRPERNVFEPAIAWCRSSNAAERQLGADVLAQLGVPTDREIPDRPFRTESVPVLRNLLDDVDEGVVMSATYALGHLGAADPSDLERLVGSGSAKVREAVAFALAGRDDAASIVLLLKLMLDTDDDVRDWATFALGTQCDVDTPEIRDALLARLEDSDIDTRGEAMAGLGRRGDPRVVSAIVRELETAEPMGLAFDAAESFMERCPGDERLARALEKWRQA